MTQDKKLIRVKEIIENSSYMVCLLGMRVSAQCGCTNILSSRDAYEIESRYGQSPEELLSAVFYNTRISQFYEFYKNEILSRRGKMNDGLRALKHLEDMGILKTIVTRDIYSLPKRAGCRNVLEIHGSIYCNSCLRCGKSYPLKAMQEAKDVPVCPQCGTAIRPHVFLRGEMIDNALMTKAVDEIMRADTLLLLGATMHSNIATTFARYFSGKKMILINDEDHYADDKADIVIDGKAMDVMGKIGF